MTTCPDCQSTNIRKDGRTAGGKQRYRCKDCGKRFVPAPGLAGRPKVVSPEKRKRDRAEYMRRYRQKKNKEN